jgi:hypothetical protein
MPKISLSIAITIAIRLGQPSSDLEHQWASDISKIAIGLKKTDQTRNRRFTHFFVARTSANLRLPTVHINTVR